MDRPLVGLRVRLVLDECVPDAPTEPSVPAGIEGIVFAYDERRNLLVVCTPSSSGADLYDVHVLRASHVAEVQVLSEGIEASQRQSRWRSGRERALFSGGSLPALSIEALRQRESGSLARARERSSKLGRGVSVLGQLVFDALDRTLPCRWDEPNIIVLDSVYVPPPYTAEGVRSLDDDEAAAQRVRLVLERELPRLVAGSPALDPQDG